jgi:hypothetical protein
MDAKISESGRSHGTVDSCSTPRMRARIRLLLEGVPTQMPIAWLHICIGALLEIVLQVTDSLEGTALTWHLL